MVLRSCQAYSAFSAILSPKFVLEKLGKGRSESSDMKQDSKKSVGGEMGLDGVLLKLGREADLLTYVHKNSIQPVLFIVAHKK